MIRTLHYRAITVISIPQDIAEEKDHIHQSLGNCRYRNWAFTKANKTKQQPQSPQSNKDDNTSVQAFQMIIPYIVVSLKDRRTLISPLVSQQHSILPTPSGISLFMLRTNP